MFWPSDLGLQICPVCFDVVVFGWSLKQKADASTSFNACGGAFQGPTFSGAQFELWNLCLQTSEKQADKTFDVSCGQAPQSNLFKHSPKAQKTASSLY